MFILAEFKDTIRVAADNFHLRLNEAVKDEINRKLANKVLLNVGLCIALKDITSLSESLILPGDSASHTEVNYRYIIFRPSIGEIITGKIRNCSSEGVHITLGFFDDIFIPSTSLQHPSRYDKDEQAWVWEYPLEDNGKHDLFMDVGEPIKFRVSDEIFEESSPIVQKLSTDTSTSEVKLPYRIIGSINESGLGLLSWWEHHNEQQSDDVDAGEEYEE